MTVLATTKNKKIKNKKKNKKQKKQKNWSVFFNSEITIENSIKYASYILGLLYL